MAKLVEIIITDECRGSGTIEDRYRRVTQFWSKEGELLGEHDTVAPKYDIAISGWTAEDEIKIVRNNA